MTITVQTIKKFSEETGISVSKVKELIRQGAIPEIQREDVNGLVLINRVTFDAMVHNNTFRIPRAERSKKRAEALQGSNHAD